MNGSGQRVRENLLDIGRPANLPLLLSKQGLYLTKEEDTFTTGRQLKGIEKLCSDQKRLLVLQDSWTTTIGVMKGGMGRHKGAKGILPTTLVAGDKEILIQEHRGNIQRSWNC